MGTLCFSQKYVLSRIVELCFKDSTGTGGCASSRKQGADQFSIDEHYMSIQGAMDGSSSLKTGQGQDHIL